LPTTARILLSRRFPPATRGIMKVYLSSTFLDLQNHREKVAKALRKAKYDVIMMEEYVARDEVVEIACQGDVAGCDAYLGLFAWRYGYIPEDNNPDRQSVTELELSAAERQSIPRLVFLVKDDANWTEQWRDPDLTRILDLRNRLKKRCTAYFDEASDLAVEVLASLRVLESTRKLRRLDAMQVMLEAQAFGPSYMHNIQEKLNALKDTAHVEIQIGPVPWWNTRLHLIAALAEEYGGTEEFVFVDANQRFVAMAPPAAVRRRLENRWPNLGTAYAGFRLKTPTLSSLEAQLWSYPAHISECLGMDEQLGVEVINRRHLEYDLALPRDGEAVEVAGKDPVFLMREILGRQSPFVVLQRDGAVDGLVDRASLAAKVAVEALEDFK
jgi:Domain of unknown function (DUF4062)